MTPDLKDLINSVETQDKTQSELEQTIKLLKDEISRLKFTIKEQRILIQSQKEKTQKKMEVPEDIEILKDIIVTQRQELNKKDKDIEILEQKIEEIIPNADIDTILRKEEIENEELINAKKLIIQLTEENELYQVNEVNAKTIISDLIEQKNKLISENENLKEQGFLSKTRDSTSDLAQQNLEQINLADNKIDDLLVKVDDLIEETIQWKEDVVPTKLNIENSMDFKSELNELSNKVAFLEEENKKLNRNIETADNISNRLVEEIDGYLNEISDLNKEIRDKNIKISALNEKYSSLKRQNIELQERTLESLNKEDLAKSQKEDNKVQGYDSETTIEKLKEEINILNREIVNLKENRTNVSNKINQNLRMKQGAPNYYQIALFMRLFQILDKDEKDTLIESIIEDLIKLKDNAIKRYIIILLITILNDLKDERIYKELIRLFNDDDWLIRLTLVKTLYRTDNDELIEIFKKPLKSLLDDVDLDVKEASEQILRKISL